MGMVFMRSEERAFGLNGRIMDRELDKLAFGYWLFCGDI